MTDDDRSSSVLIRRMLDRSEELNDKILSHIGDATFDGSQRGEAVLGMCYLSLEHGAALRTLMTLGLATSATGVMRLQFEALLRGMWLLYVAGDGHVDKLLAPLTAEAEQGAKNLPGASEMVEQIGKGVGRGVPVGAHLMLKQFKDGMRPAKSP